MLDSALYTLLHADNINGFNQQRRSGPIDMRGGDFRGVDLRELNAESVDFTDAYLRSADQRGVDLRNAYIEGASLAHAQISGTYFPVELTADEILMSVKLGTRLRYRAR